MTLLSSSRRPDRAAIEIAADAPAHVEAPRRGPRRRGDRRPHRLLRRQADDGGRLSLVHGPGADDERTPGGRPDHRDRRRGRPAAQPVAPGLRLLSDPQHEGTVGPRHRVEAAGERDRPRDHLQLRRRERPAERVPRAAAGRRRQRHGRGRQDVDRHPAGRRVAHVRRSRVRADRSRRAGRRRREEPVRLRAVRAVVRPPHDPVHLPHRQGRPLPLAVLRALRRRLAVRVRRADADDRLHGRVPGRRR